MQIHQLKEQLLDYFIANISETTGLVADNDAPGAAASIAVTGMGLSDWIIDCERGYISKATVKQKTLTLLWFLHKADTGTTQNGFHYHFVSHRPSASCL